MKFGSTLMDLIEEKRIFYRRSDPQYHYIIGDKGDTFIKFKTGTSENKLEMKTMRTIPVKDLMADDWCVVLPLSTAEELTSIIS